MNATIVRITAPILHAECSAIFTKVSACDTILQQGNFIDDDDDDDQFVYLSLNKIIG